jgi:hypothetical protein
VSTGKRGHATWQRRLSTLLAGGVLGAAAIVTPEAVAVAAPEATPALAPAADVSVEQAIAQAHRTGAPVEATSAASATTTVTANPDGTVTFLQSASPSRKKVDGQWRNLDATLIRNPDGSLSPRLSGTPLTLSGGGSSPMAVLGVAGLNAAIGAPMTLPEPTVSGATATYSAVLPGVDLQVTAHTSGGFSEVFVIQDASAAANPALATLALPLSTTGLTVATDNAGNLTGTDNAGRIVLTAPSPSMWDSANPSTASTLDAAGISRTAETGQAATSTAKGPGATAHRSKMGTAVRGGRLELTPNKTLLSAATTRFPVYIDPTFEWQPAAGTFSGWATISKNYPDTNYWKSTPDPHGRMQVGYSGSILSRTLVNFTIPTSVLAGATLDTAKLNMKETWAYSCSARSVNLYAPTGTLSASNATWNYWDGIALGSAVDSQNVAYGYDSSCPADAIPFDVKSTVLADVNAGKKTQTFLLAAADQSDKYAWKEFLETGPSLEIRYNHTTNKPSGLHTSPSTACNGSIIGEGSVTLYATVSDPDKGTVGAAFKVWVTSSGTTVTTTDPQQLYYTSGSTAVLRVPVDKLNSYTAAGGATKFSWAVQATDYKASSSWSTTCSFTYDRTRPGQPEIAPVTSAAIGQSLDIAISPPATGTVPTSYLYQLNGGPYGTVNATAGAATVTIIPTRFTNTITVTSRSAGGNIGGTSPITFNADPAQTADDADLNGDGIADLVTVGGTRGIAAGLWLASGKSNGKLGPAAANIGSHGNGIFAPGTVGSPTDFTGAQPITGHFGGPLQDVLVYYPPGSGRNEGGAVILRGNGDGSTIRAELDPNYTKIDDTALKGLDFNDFQEVLSPIQLANAGAHTNSYPDLIGIASKPDNTYFLAYYPNNGVSGGYSAQPLPTKTPAGGTDWNTWTITSAQTATGTALFLWKASTGQLYLWNNVTFSADTGTLAYTQYQLSVSFNTGKNLALYAADINDDDTADLWTVGDGAAATAWLVSGLNAGTGTVAAQSAQKVLTGTHAWMLNDYTSPDATKPLTAYNNPAKDSIGTLPATATAATGANWHGQDLFDPDLELTGTTSLTTSTQAIDTTTDFTLDFWAKPAATGGTVLSQDGTNTAVFQIYAEPTSRSWRFVMSNGDTVSPTWTYAIAPNGSFTPGVWAHVTASYTKTTGVMDLHVNGKDLARAVHLTPWMASAAKPFRIGANRISATAFGSYFTGQVAEVQTFNQVVIHDDGYQPTRDFDGDGKNDMIVRHTDGTLRMYRGNGAGGIIGGDGSYIRIATSWGNMNEVFTPGDFDGDGNNDIIGVYSDGVLRLYPGNGAGGLIGGYKVLANSWSNMHELLSPGDYNGDGKADIIGRYSDGVLRLYPGDGAGSLIGSYTTLATQWNSMRELFSPGDFNGDGKADVIGVYSDGVLRLYPGNGNSPLGGYTALAPQWGNMSLLLSPGDFNGDTHPDIAGRYSDNVMRLYRGSGAGTIIPTNASWTSLGTDWSRVAWAS